MGDVTVEQYEFRRANRRFKEIPLELFVTGPSLIPEPTDTEKLSWVNNSIQFKPLPSAVNVFHFL